MKKLMACVMIVCIGMFCSLGCTEDPEKKTEGTGTTATDTGPDTTPPADTDPEKTEEKAPE